MSATETKSNGKTLRDMKVGESVIGYVKTFVRLKNSMTPDTDNPVLVTKDGKEILFLASGDVTWLKERLSEKVTGTELESSGGIGVLVKITKKDKPDGYKGRQKYFADIGFNIKDVKDPSEFESKGGNRRTGTDDQGFEYA